MQEEIELLRSLQHPNIVTYLGTDICDENKLLYIFTEWVPGGSIQAQTQCRIYLARFTANSIVSGTDYKIWSLIRGNCAQIR